MRSIFFLFLVTYFILPIWVKSSADDLSADTILHGLKLHSQVNSSAELKDRQKWMNNLREKQVLMTNEAVTVQLSKTLVLILNSEKASNEDKCAAAYLIGLFRLTEGIEALIRNFLLISNAAMEPDLMPIEGERPAQLALIKLGESSLPKIVELIESTTNSNELKYGAQAILMIKGQKEGYAFLGLCMDNQKDAKKRINLNNARLSEYFTDPKYQASGPHTPGETQEQETD